MRNRANRPVVPPVVESPCSNRALFPMIE